MASPLTIALVAGEASGDNLGAALIEAIRARDPDARFWGVAGPRMRAAGCEVFADSEQLAIMGLAEVLRHLPRLFRLRSRIVRAVQAAPPAVFVGIDAPEFNLGLARKLKAAGIRTVQYVSPQVWAWRQGRVRTIGEACDLVLCLLPFETAFYARHGVQAEFVGHPLADQFPLVPDRAAARAALGLRSEDRVLAILPGSRMGEVARLGECFAGAAQWLSRQLGPIRCIAPMVSPALQAVFEQQWRHVAGQQPLDLLTGQSQLALAAADAVLVASGTATLETLLSKRPMVVAYRLAPLTAALLRRFKLVKVAHFSQPNLLAGDSLVPEFFQEQATPAALGAALRDALELSPEARAALESRFLEIHHRLRRDGAGLAADAVLAVARQRGRSPG